MTPTNELVWAKLRSRENIRKEFHPSELEYLLKLVEEDVNKSYRRWGDLLH